MNILVKKQYVVFGVDRNEIYWQMCDIKNEFSCAGWEVKENISKIFLTDLIVIKDSIRVFIYPYLVGYSRAIRWESCWISSNITNEEIKRIIMPLSISDTPEIHFF